MIPFESSRAADDSLTVEWLLETAGEENHIELTTPALSFPADLAEAMKDYRAGRYRRAMREFQKYRALWLPDGNTEHVTFMLGECYRILNLNREAQKHYNYVLSRFPDGKLVPSALYRKLQHAYRSRNIEQADSITDVFNRRFDSHPLFYSVYYEAAKLHFRKERFGEATELLNKIPRSSSRHFQAQFLVGLCYIKLKKNEKALFHLSYVKENCRNTEIVGETYVVLGDLYDARKEYETALSFYTRVSKASPRWSYAQVKIARVHLDLGVPRKTETMAKEFMENYPGSDYYFEMVTLLERAYAAMGDMERAARLEKGVYSRITEARLAFEFNEELALIRDLLQGWKQIELNAIIDKDESGVAAARAAVKKILRLEDQCFAVLKDLGAAPPMGEEGEIPGLAERRYARRLENAVARLEDSVEYHSQTLEILEDKVRGDTTIDSSAQDRIAGKKQIVDRLTEAVATTTEELKHLRSLGWRLGADGRFNDKMQAKFVDWAFSRYQHSKEALADLNRRASSQRRKSESKDSTRLSGGEVVASLSEIDRENLKKTIVQRRERLLTQVRTLLDAGPGNAFAPHILMRLAELHHDAASDDFDARLQEYEKHLAATTDSSSLRFPEYKLGRVLSTYHKIMREYPSSWVADDAHYHAALGYRKLGDDSTAVGVLERLIDEYPESEYYVAANMNVGRYYFEHPKIKGGNGYKLAEEAYRRVLYYRDQPQFVEALYHLGWCYYMQDSYDEAIGVFKYLIEEVKLDFGTESMEERQVANPLLRAEAIDYIAISFDEKGNLREAISFLDLIGNPDYAALVLKRIGELREEDLDYTRAIDIYSRLLEKYPLSHAAPEATVGLIKLYEMTGQTAKAMAQRQEFFKTYAPGADWRESVTDTSKMASVDSMAISIGFFVADAMYRDAEQRGDTAMFRQAVDDYARLAKSYPNDPRSTEATWNMAVILETKLRRTRKAYSAYLAYSKIADADSSRRKQAALNAVAIAQRHLPPDSTAKKGLLEPAAAKVIEAAENYSSLFPQGRELGDVLLAAGAVFFNRKMYSAAEEIYGKLISRGESSPHYHEALLLIGKSRFSQDKWVPASEAFETVWQHASNEELKSEARELLLQSKYLHARQLLESKAYESAAGKFEEIEKSYPGSSYGDVVLFGAAEAYEKLEKWTEAAEAYLRLQGNYPESDFAPGALFNAASDYEHAQLWGKAAEAYELLASRYSQSPKAKDALFNVGFCYEKMGRLEKMAEANERYSRLYPGEKDVELMLLRSAKFYMKAEMYEKAAGAYKNFVWRYPRSPKTVEAHYYIGKSYLARGDVPNALLAFQQAQQQNENLAKVGLEANPYYAAEAAYEVAEMKREDFRKIDFDVSAEEMDEVRRRKSEYMTTAAQAYQGVVKNKSERMFEAGYRIGEMFRTFAINWYDQRRHEKDPIKAALAEKDIGLVSATLMKKAMPPLIKMVELASDLDSIPPGQQSWIDSSKQLLARAPLEGGKYIVDGIKSMYEAPIPREIRSRPLYHYQYLQQLNETLTPLKTQAQQYYLEAYKEFGSAVIPDSARKALLNEFAHMTYKIANDYGKLAEQILMGMDKLPSNLSEVEREELIFQFEDIVFELQDRALFAYEDALSLMKRENADKSKWYSITLKRLARLDPEKYGKNFFEPLVVTTDSTWIVRSDSVAEWNTEKVAKDGWWYAEQLSRTYRPAKLKEAPILWHPGGTTRDAYFQKYVFVPGAPKDATLHYGVFGAYELFINGMLVSSDTSASRGIGRVDSITGLESLIKGGDNLLALKVTAPDTMRNGIIAELRMLVDTTEIFQSRIEAPKAKRAVRQVAALSAGRTEDTSSSVSGVIDTTAGEMRQNSDSVESRITNGVESIDELERKITEYKTRTRSAAQDIRKESIEVQKLRIRSDKVDEELTKLKNEIATLKNRK